jgi:ribosomal-protein-alanine N-acetyltransferase
MSAQALLLPLSFRPMGKNDLKAVLFIENQSYGNPWSKGIFEDCLHSDYTCTVAVQATSVVGYLILSVILDEAHFLNVCVHPEKRRQGIARALMREHIKRLRQQGVAMAYLEVRKSNRAAQDLYQSLGFYQIGLRRGYYPAAGGREDAVVMGMFLKS